MVDVKTVEATVEADAKSFWSKVVAFWTNKVIPFLHVVNSGLLVYVLKHLA